jgi:hypothetical protein
MFSSTAVGAKPANWLIDNSGYQIKKRFGPSKTPERKQSKLFAYGDNAVTVRDNMLQRWD